MAKCWKNRRLFSSFFCCSLLLAALFPLSWAEACQSKLEARSASLFLLTTPEGADLPAGCELRDFPLLVRLNSETFDFGSARPDGSDLRFYSADGQPLAHQVEAWDPAAGSAVVWVRIPLVRGNERQELKLMWGKETPAEQTKVFDTSNGFASVWHLGPEVRD
jgi:biopolymer transport protein ExbB